MEKTTSYLYQEIAESLRRRIAAGELQAGDRLPSVREMAGQWDCTPGTVSRAYKMLGREGLVTAQRGSGTRVAPSALQPEEPVWQWASLVNRAEQFLLEAMSGGNNPAQVEAALSVAVARWQELQREGVPAGTAEGQTHTLRFAGSHDLTVDLLGQMLAEALPGARLEASFVGSLGGLMALARNEADIAGAHLWDEATDTYNEPFVRRLLPGRDVILLTLAHRSLGLITRPGNGEGPRELVALTRPGERLVNRQPGSGTRVWLDAQLKALGVAPEAIPGYEREESTHMAVARAVADGEATAGIGIHAAAAAYGLGFTQLTQERYDLVIPEPVWQTPAAQALADVIRSDRFQEAVQALGGYDTTASGRTVASNQ